MDHLGFFFIGRCGRQAEDDGAPEFFTESEENLSPMFGQVMALIENDEPDVGGFQRFNGGFCSLVEPRQGTVFANLFSSHLFTIFLHLFLKIIGIFYAEVLKPSQTGSLVNGFTIFN